MNHSIIIQFSMLNLIFLVGLDSSGRFKKYVKNRLGRCVASNSQRSLSPPYEGNRLSFADNERDEADDLQLFFNQLISKRINDRHLSRKLHADPQLMEQLRIIEAEWERLQTHIYDAEFVELSEESRQGVISQLHSLLTRYRQIIEEQGTRHDSETRDIHRASSSSQSIRDYGYVQDGESTYLAVRAPFRRNGNT